MMNTRELEGSMEPHKTKLLCPRCGGEVVARLAFSGLFCGVRAVASCKKGCQWESREQVEMDTAASDGLFQ